MSDKAPGDGDGDVYVRDELVLAQAAQASRDGWSIGVVATPSDEAGAWAVLGLRSPEGELIELELEPGDREVLAGLGALELVRVRPTVVAADGRGYTPGEVVLRISRRPGQRG